jgi:ribonucleoside-diphosphate reductase alpha chain
MMLAREFIPNTPCLVNSGKPDGQLAACFVIDVPDSLSGILESAKSAGIIHQTGGGTGFTFEKLRPAGAMVGSPWREYGYDARIASRYSAFYPREK